MPLVAFVLGAALVYAGLLCRNGAPLRSTHFWGNLKDSTTFGKSLALVGFVIMVVGFVSWRLQG